MTVNVQSQHGIQEMEIAALPEGTRLEYYAVKQFLEIYNNDREISYEIAHARLAGRCL